MNKTAILHIPKSQYAFAYRKNEIRLRLRAEKSDIESIEVIYAVKYEWMKNRKTVEMIKSFSDELFDYFTVSLEVSDTRIGYIFLLKSGGIKYFYSEDGVTESYDYAKSYYNFFQYPYINENDLHNELGWCRDAVVYQIFVERFNRGNESKNCDYITKAWKDKPTPKGFYGGDLDGISKKLDYLKELGINCIYMTPIFTSPSNHKYDTVDYLNVDEMFGGNNALKELIEKAHRVGIKILLDAVFNHCSDKFEYFQDAVKNGEKSPYYNWFIINGKKPDVQQGNYERFAHCNNMPKLNTNNTEVQNYLLGIATRWITEFKIDGWRLDVSDEVSHDFWKQFRKAVKKANENAIIIGENWHDARPWLTGDEYDSIMNYSFTKACLDYFAFEKFNARQFADRLSAILMRNTDQVNHMMLNILDSHDTERFLTNANENKNKLKCALAVLFFFVGMPCIYYGSEIGLCGGYDPDSRRTFNWDESVWDKDLLTEVKDLIRLKKEKINGEIRLYEQNDLFILQRDELTLVINNTKNTIYYKSDKENLALKPESYEILTGGIKI